MQHGACIDDGDWVINAQNTCIDDGNWVMSAGKTCNAGRLAAHHRSYFLKQSSCRRHASRYPLQRRNLLLHSGIPTIDGGGKSVACDTADSEERTGSEWPIRIWEKAL
jgi:hypothetical protein